MDIHNVLLYYIEKHRTFPIHRLENVHLLSKNLSYRFLQQKQKKNIQKIIKLIK